MNDHLLYIRFTGSRLLRITFEVGWSGPSAASLMVRAPLVLGAGAGQVSLSLQLRPRHPRPPVESCSAAAGKIPAVAVEDEPVTAGDRGFPLAERTRIAELTADAEPPDKPPPKVFRGTPR